MSKRVNGDIHDQAIQWILKRDREGASDEDRAALESWLASRAGTPGPPTVTGVRVPDTGGLSSTSVLFEADWGSSRRSPSSSACRACPASCAASPPPRRRGCAR